MKKVKFISDGFPDVGHLKSALEIAKEHSADMSIGELKHFGSGDYQTILKIQDSNDILLVLTDLTKTPRKTDE
jgi:hypothetical protein